MQPQQSSKSVEKSPRKLHIEVPTSPSPAPTETPTAIHAIRAAAALVKNGAADLLEPRLRDRARLLLESVLATEVVSDIVMETATALALDRNVQAHSPALRQAAVEVLEKAMSSVLATTSPPSTTSLFASVP